MELTRGCRPLRRLLLEARHCDVRELDLPRFRAWLAFHLGRWRRDPVFRERVRLREIRRSRPELVDLERRCRRARREDAASPAFALLTARERQVSDLGKALAGLSAARQAASAERRTTLQAKLEVYRERHRAAEAELADLVRSSPERLELLRLRRELERLRREAGVEAHEERLREFQRGRGRSSGESGRSFEERVRHLTRAAAARDRKTPEDRLRVLVGVTLGAARTELDQLVVRLPQDPRRPVTVLAVVEVKRSLDDLAHGFRQRQENLAWLTGGDYDPAAWRNRAFPEGHFDRPAVHRQDGAEFVLDRQSFRLFRRDPETGHFLRGLYFVTRPGRMRGLSSAALGRVAARIAGDPDWDVRDEEYLQRLLAWCRSLAHDLETPDVLRLYAAQPRLARQILLAGQAVLAGYSQRS